MTKTKKKTATIVVLGDIGEKKIGVKGIYIVLFAF